MTTLYAITDDLLALDALLTESAGEITPEIDAWMAEYAAQLASKTDAVGFYVRDLEAHEAALTDEIARLQQKKAACAAKQARVKEWVKYNMTRLGVRELRGSIYAFAIQKNGGKQPIAYATTDPAAFAERFRDVVTTVQINRDAVRAALEAGESVDGATLLPRGESVRLR